MLNLIEWNKPLKVNGREFRNVEDARKAFADYEGRLVIELNTERIPQQEQQKVTSKHLRITVKQYMTKESSPGFDFMSKWNNNVPMPMRTMEGEIVGETKGMYKMKLRGVYQEGATVCSHCGRKLTNEVSKMYGIGPICGQHFHIAAPNTIAEYEQRKDEIKEQIQSVTWEGWVIKSAITESKELQKTA